MSLAQDKQREKAEVKLRELAGDQLELKRPVFFVPGWTDETCVCWKTPYMKGGLCMEKCLQQVVKNPELAHYISFSVRESKSCSSFLDFGNILRKKIRTEIGQKQAFDLVGHSMGGLDAVAAITHPDDPLKNVNSLITVATPHQGSQLGEIGPIVMDYRRHHALQCVNLDPDQLPIQLINRLEKRKQLLKSIDKLYCLMGTRDQAVMGSARFNKEGMEPEFYKKKVEVLVIDGATHSQEYGITQDPRTILAVLKILCGIELKKPNYNYGYIYKK